MAKGQKIGLFNDNTDRKSFTIKFRIPTRKLCILIGKYLPQIHSASLLKGFGSNLAKASCRLIRFLEELP